MQRQNVMPGRSMAAIAFAAFAIAACMSVAASTIASELPGDGIEVVIHSNFGGGTDRTARRMILSARHKLNSNMYVVSRTGGAGAAAHKYFLSRPANGRTLLAVTQTHLYTMATGHTELTIDDLVGVARAMDDPTFITVPNDSPYESLGQLLKASRERPLAWGVALHGGTEHVGLALLSEAARFNFVVVDYGSGSRAIEKTLTGDVTATLPNVSEARELILSGRLRALAVMSRERLQDFPDVPTTFELGYPIATSTTRGYAVHKDTPDHVVQKLSKALVSAMRDEQFKSYLRRAGLNAEESVAGTKEWTEQMRAEFEKAVRVLKKIRLAQTE